MGVPRQFQSEFKEATAANTVNLPKGNLNTFKIFIQVEGRRLRACTWTRRGFLRQFSREFKEVTAANTVYLPRET